jgi:hypothetical protein
MEAIANNLKSSTHLTAIIVMHSIRMTTFTYIHGFLTFNESLFLSMNVTSGTNASQYVMLKIQYVNEYLMVFSVAVLKLQNVVHID